VGGEVPSRRGAGSRTRQRVPIFEIGTARQPPLQRRPASPERQDDTTCLVYYGFRFDDVPTGFDDLLLQRLTEMGIVTEFVTTRTPAAP
jgi:hypothetical protein